ncbi:MAG: formylglycine-generating enzyme family protein [Planctomycetaceae bacterium]
MQETVQETGFQARDFCNWLTELVKDQVPVSCQAGLPTEAQWEYACRLMKTSDGQPYCVETEYYTGDGEAALRAAGWFGEEFSGGSTHPVGRLRPTDFGLHDLHGNVWEWCNDVWNEDAYKTRADGVADPRVFASDIGESEDNAYRVFRGGCWSGSAWNCRAAFRGRGWPGIRDWFVGFRVCLFSGPVPSQSSQQTGASSEPLSVDEARRQAAAESEDMGGDDAEVDLSRALLPKRSDGTKF